MNVSYDFKDKVAIVVGGAAGMGKATSILLASSGAKVLIADFDEEKGQDVVNTITDQGGVASFVFCDVGNKEDDERIVEKAVKRYGHIDSDFLTEIILRRQ